MGRKLLDGFGTRRPTAACHILRQNLDIVDAILAGHGGTKRASNGKHMGATQQPLCCRGGNIFVLAASAADMDDRKWRHLG